MSIPQTTLYLAFLLLLTSNTLIDQKPRPADPLPEPDPPAQAKPIIIFSKPPKPSASCTGKSIWQLYDFGAPGNTVEFRFQQRFDVNGVCKHFFKIRSRCTLYEVVYQTIHDTDTCPPYHLNEVSLPAINLGNCPSIRLAALEADIVAAYPERSQGEYCLNLGAPHGTVNWGEYEPTHVLGPRRVWFS